MRAGQWRVLYLFPGPIIGLPFVSQSAFGMAVVFVGQIESRGHAHPGLVRCGAAAHASCVMRHPGRPLYRADGLLLYAELARHFGSRPRRPGGRSISRRYRRAGLGFIGVIRQSRKYSPACGAEHDHGVLAYGGVHVVAAVCPESRRLFQERAAMGL